MFTSLPVVTRAFQYCKYFCHSSLNFHGMRVDRTQQFALFRAWIGGGGIPPPQRAQPVSGLVLTRQVYVPRTPLYSYPSLCTLHNEVDISIWCKLLGACMDALSWDESHGDCSERFTSVRQGWSKKKRLNKGKIISIVVRFNWNPSVFLYSVFMLDLTK